MSTKLLGNDRLELLRGDITKEVSEAIVNAANSSLMGGGGVDGAIHRAGGPSILEECKKIREQRGKLPAGQAVMTSGGKLPAKFVIHTVGPIWQGGQHHEEELLRSCYQSCLRLAREKKIKTIAFPSISTGAYRYPVLEAASIALNTVTQEMSDHPGAHSLVRFVLFDDATLSAYEEALEGIGDKE